MGASSAMPLERRLLASAALTASAVGLGVLGFRSHFGEGAAFGLAAAVVGSAAIGIARQRVLPQVMARGVAWCVALPTLLGTAAALFQVRWPDAWAAFFALTSAGALLIARPGLHTSAAKAEFNPLAYRRVFLAGASASAAVGAAIAFFAAALFAWGSLSDGLLAGAIGAAVLGSVAGVVRMRSWGVLLGIVLSVAAVVVALFSPGEVAALALAFAIPGALLAAPLVAVRVAPASRPPRLDACSLLPGPGADVHDLEDEPVFTRVRIVDEPAPAPEAHEEAEASRFAPGR